MGIIQPPPVPASRIKVLWQAPATLESYGGVPGTGNPAANVAAINAWLADVAANPTNPPPLSFNGKMFSVGANAITFPYHNLNMKGGLASRSVDSRTGGLISTLTSGAAFTFQGYAPLLEGVVLRGAGRTSGLSATAEFDAPSGGRGDLDALLVDTEIGEANFAVVVRGRGFTMRGGALYDAASGADLGMPVTLADPIDNTNTREGGSRVYSFNGVRFHQIIDASVQNIDTTNGPFLYGIQISGCYHDTLGKLFRGYLNHGLIQGNIHFFGNTQGIRLLASKNSLISGNTFGGGPMTPAEFTAAYPSLINGPAMLTNAIRLEGPTTNVTFSNNRVSFVQQSPFYAVGGNIHDNLTIRDNSLYRTMLGNDAGTYYPVQVDSGATLNGFAFTGNRAFLDTLTNNASAGWISNSGTISGMKFADNRENGQLNARVVNTSGGTTTYVRDHQPRDNYTTISANQDITLVTTSNGEHIRHTGNLSADRALTLSATNSFPGAKFRITRTGGGAFNLNVGAGPLKVLAQNQWCEVIFDGTAWYLSAFGSL